MRPTHINLGLVGFPLGHSVSPQIHAAALESTGLAGKYHPFPIPPLPEGLPLLKTILARVTAGEIQGLNVTIPHKQTVIDFLDALDPSAAAVGAVNTIGLADGKLTGWNTDAAGFMDDLHAQFPDPQGRALVLGAGGAARAVVFGLQQAGWELALAARDPRQADRLSTDLGVKSKSLSLPPAASDLAGFRPDLLVNATPVGMSPYVHQSPWPPALQLPPHCVVYDLVYNPRETRLLAWAHKRGLRAAGGLGMLVRQAAFAFEIWTMHKPDLGFMFTAAENALAQTDKEAD